MILRGEAAVEDMVRRVRVGRREERVWRSGVVKARVTARRAMRTVKVFAVVEYEVSAGGDGDECCGLFDDIKKRGLEMGRDFIVVSE